MLTTQQLATLRAGVFADPTAAALLAAGNWQDVQAWLNAPASPDFYLWDSQYTPEKLRTAITSGITQLDALTASKRDSLLWLVNGTHDMGRALTRAAFDDLTGSQNTLKAAIMDGGKRKATRAEKMLATGTGSQAVPATVGWEGQVDGQSAIKIVYKDDGVTIWTQG